MESNLIDWLIEKGGKPEEYTWKQVGKMFHLTGEAARGQWKRRKKSITSKGQNTSTAIEGLPKEIPGYIVSSFRSEGAWYKKSEEVEEDGVSLEDRLEESFDKILNKYHSFSPEKPPMGGANKTLVVAISDCHVGSEIDKNNIFGVKYDGGVFEARITQMVDFVITQRSANKQPFESFTMFDLGDSLDGYEGKTTRGITGGSSHTLPQNLDSGEQWETYVDVLTAAWKRIVESNVANEYQFVGASNSNHGGHFDYIAMQAVSKLISKLWDVNTTISKKFIDVHVVTSSGVEYTYAYTHGKDATEKSRGLPLNLDSKSREYLQGVLDRLKVPSGGNTIVLKGDLHMTSTNRSQNAWWYENVPSLFGSSNWAMHNFTSTQPGFYFEVLDGKIRSKGVVDVE